MQITSDKQYKELACHIRIDCLKMCHTAQSCHVGCMMSLVDLLAVLGEFMRLDPTNPTWPERDRLILSKGHGGGALYAMLAEKGFFPKEWLKTYFKDNNKLSGHISHYVPGVDLSTGALGHGLPVAVGMAVSGRYCGSDRRVFCIVGEGDLNEGSSWEAIMFAAQHGLDNLTMIVDYNRIQCIGRIEDVIELEPFAEKFSAFRWAVSEIDGHNYQQIEDALNSLPLQKGKPSCIIAHTVKGKGVSWMEDTVESHFKSINDEELAQLLRELEAEHAV